MKKLTWEQEAAIASTILNRLESRRFSEWYNTGNFDKYITHENDTVPYQEQKLFILEEIKGMFGLDKF